MKPAALLCIVCCLPALPARAQSAPYVAASVGAAIFRGDYSESGAARYPARAGEVLDFALRAGTPLTTRFGVEAEFSRSAKTDETGASFGPVIQLGTTLSERGYTVAGGSTGAPSLIDGTLIAPTPIIVTPTTARQATSLNAAASARQHPGSMVDLVYLAGIAFSREVTESSYSILPAVRTLPIALPRVERNRFVNYDIHPIVGLEAHIAFTDHARLVAGIRLQGLSDGWLLRPGVGLGWSF